MTSPDPLPEFPADLIAAAKAAMIAASNVEAAQFADEAAIAGDIDYFIKAGMAGVFRQLAANQAQLVQAFNKVGDTILANSSAAKQNAYLNWASAIDAANLVPTPSAEEPPVEEPPAQPV